MWQVGQIFGQHYKAENFILFCSLTNVDFDFLGILWLQFSRWFSFSVGCMFGHRNRGKRKTLTYVDHKVEFKLTKFDCRFVDFFGLNLTSKESRIWLGLAELQVDCLLLSWPPLTSWLGQIWLLLTKSNIAYFTGLFWTVIWKANFDFDFVLLYSLSLLSFWYNNKNNWSKSFLHIEVFPWRLPNVVSSCLGLFSVFYFMFYLQLLSLWFMFNVIAIGKLNWKLSLGC